MDLQLYMFVHYTLQRILIFCKPTCTRRQPNKTIHHLGNGSTHLNMTQVLLKPFFSTVWLFI